MQDSAPGDANTLLDMVRSLAAAFRTAARRETDHLCRLVK